MLKLHLNIDKEIIFWKFDIIDKVCSIADDEDVENNGDKKYVISKEE